MDKQFNEKFTNITVKQIRTSDTDDNDGFSKAKIKKEKHLHLKQQ